MQAYLPTSCKPEVAQEQTEINVIAYVGARKNFEDHHTFLVISCVESRYTILPMLESALRVLRHPTVYKALASYRSKIVLFFSYSPRRHNPAIISR
jgi:hypothetical protein